MNKERQLVGMKNNPGMAFNPITLEYDNSVQGEVLKKRDEESKYRALMRACNIDKHTNVGFNILTGEDRTIMQKRMKNEIDPNIYKENFAAIQEMGTYNRDLSFMGSNIYNGVRKSPINEFDLQNSPNVAPQEEDNYPQAALYHR